MVFFPMNNSFKFHSNYWLSYVNIGVQKCMELDRPNIGYFMKV